MQWNMRYGSRDQCDDKDGLVFLDVGRDFVAFEKVVGATLPDNCEDIFDWRGPFVIQRHWQNDMVFILNPDKLTASIVRVLCLWIAENVDKILWLTHYLSDVEESEDSLTQSF